MKKRIASLLCFAAVAAAQSPAFDVASIKPTNYQGGPLRVSARVDADGISFSNVAVRQCIQRAYGIRPYQLKGPAWIDTERYSIVAKASGRAPEEKILEMLKTLLAERFKLVFHRESQELPVYALVVAKNGLKLKEVTDDGPTQIDGGDGDNVVFERAPLDMLARELGRSLDRPVLNQTGLTGRYTFKLAWSEERRNGPGAGAVGGDASDPSGLPSVFTALPEKLGLKLEARRAAVEILVIDRVEKPSEN